MSNTLKNKEISKIEVITFLKEIGTSEDIRKHLSEVLGDPTKHHSLRKKIMTWNNRNPDHSDIKWSEDANVRMKIMLLFCPEIIELTLQFAEKNQEKDFTMTEFFQFLKKHDENLKTSFYQFALSANGASPKQGEEIFTQILWREEHASTRKKLEKQFKTPKLKIKETGFLNIKAPGENWKWINKNLFLTGLKLDDVIHIIELNPSKFPWLYVISDSNRRPKIRLTNEIKTGIELELKKLKEFCKTEKKIAEKWKGLYGGVIEPTLTSSCLSNVATRDLP